MVCCSSCGFDEFFDAKHAAKELKRYRRKGPIPSTRLLIDLLVREGVDRASLLDVGGGIGAIQHELLQHGARESIDIDGSRAYLDAARSEAERRGHADRTRFELGDFAELAESVDGADIVTLDRVICCYPDMPALVTPSAARARRLYGLVFPRRHWLMRAARPLVNAWSRLRKSPMRFYLHHAADVERIARAAGLVPRAERRTLLWQIVVYARSADEVTSSSRAG